jgi:hypothetical protein
MEKSSQTPHLHETPDSRNKLRSDFPVGPLSRRPRLGSDQVDAATARARTALLWTTAGAVTWTGRGSRPSARSSETRRGAPSISHPQAGSSRHGRPQPRPCSIPSRRSPCGARTDYGAHSALRRRPMHLRGSDRSPPSLRRRSVRPRRAHPPPFVRPQRVRAGASEHARRRQQYGAQVCRHLEVRRGRSRQEQPGRRPRRLMVW